MDRIKELYELNQHEIYDIEIEELIELINNIKLEDITI